uniref:U1 small nuclear ribonucleoprotein C n=1 Tax=Syphacia muris TaxID=451379 RepID=A0A0N5A8R6_9BILA
MSDNRNTVDKRHRGNRGGVKKRMAVGGMAGLGVLGGPGPMRALPRPQFLSGPNPLLVPYGLPPARPSFGPIPGAPGPKFGFFDPPQPFGPSNFEFIF